MGSNQSFCSLNRAIRKHIKDLEEVGLRVELGHIKGHQDDIQRFESLSRWSQLNVIVDGKAKSRLAENFYSKNTKQIKCETIIY